jgi:excisionase family DNA binding protein
MATAVPAGAEQTLAPRFISLADAEPYCGLSTETLRRLIRAGRLRAYKPVAGRVLLDRLQLEEVILASARPA